jgi:hypothetical protein
MVSKDPNADGQHAFGSLGKLLKMRQALSIPWYLEQRGYGYLHGQPRLVGVLAAIAVSPSSNPESFAKICTSALWLIILSSA